MVQKQKQKDVCILRVILYWIIEFELQIDLWSVRMQISRIVTSIEYVLS